MGHAWCARVPGICCGFCVAEHIATVLVHQGICLAQCLRLHGWFPVVLQWAFPFNTAVDTLRFPTYRSVVEQPMDFGTVKSRLDHGQPHAFTCWLRAGQFMTACRRVHSCRGRSACCLLIMRSKTPHMSLARAHKQFLEAFCRSLL